MKVYELIRVNFPLPIVHFVVFDETAKKAGTKFFSVPASFLLFNYLTFKIIYSRPADKSLSRLGSFASVF